MGVENSAVPFGLLQQWVTVLKIVCLNQMVLEHFRNLSILNTQNNDVDFTFLLEDKPVLQLVDGILNPQLSTYSRLSESQRLSSTGSRTSRDIQLQCLDAFELYYNELLLQHQQVL
ncbi:hypothetical protein NQ317_012402 [Molorchus minor]|uniref:Uncharacterized protein n=1 Tax=Molorchus minor TaxID=1323400 RepID=A0ABQ9JI57_9CUCU|nr:hypothetical protein NQ317_012402 [Molorchus minor]